MECMFTWTLWFSSWNWSLAPGFAQNGVSLKIGLVGLYNSRLCHVNPQTNQLSTIIESNHSKLAAPRGQTRRKVPFLDTGSACLSFRFLGLQADEKQMLVVHELHSFVFSLLQPRSQVAGGMERDAFIFYTVRAHLYSILQDEVHMYMLLIAQPIHTVNGFF